MFYTIQHMSLQAFIQQHKPLIERNLTSFFNQKIASQNDDLTKRALQDLCDFTMPGKMLRGNFVILSHDMFDGANKDVAISVAAALEINQSGLLIHDDIMDNDRIRRGHKAMFTQYEDIGRERQAASPTQYGISLGILTGDASYFLSYEILSNLNAEPHVVQKIIQIYSKEMLITAHGQLLDTDYGQTPYNPTEEEIVQMYLRKTGRYSFVLPLMLGAILAGADQDQTDLIKEFGTSLGILFQIKDDEIGLFGDQSQTGKPVGSDIRENKKTLARLFLYTKANSEEQALLDSCFGNPDLQANSIEKIKDLAEKYGLRQDLSEQVKKYALSAEKNVDDFKISDQYKTILRELIQYLQHRGK